MCCCAAGDVPDGGGERSPLHDHRPLPSVLVLDHARVAGGSLLLCDALLIPAHHETLGARALARIFPVQVSTSIAHNIMLLKGMYGNTVAGLGSTSGFAMLGCVEVSQQKLPNHRKKSHCQVNDLPL